MINLEQVSGLPIEVDEKTYQLAFKNGLPEVKPSVRKFSEMQAVLMDPEAKSERDEMYYMYRDVHVADNEYRLRQHHIRYDITVIPPSVIGKEFNKTLGHYHSAIPGTNLGYPEVYEVLHGEALFLIQKLDVDGQVRMVIAFKAGVGDKVIYPPNYGHSLINIGTDVLVTSNWVSDQYTADYKTVQDKHGMAYYVIQDEAKKFDFAPNSNYANTPAIRTLQAKDNPGAKMLPAEPMYQIGANDPGLLEFLNAPAKYAVELSEISS